MKNLILILLFMPLILFGQKNILSVIYQPTDMGLGLRYDREITDIGLYVSISQGNYQISENERINNHIKLAVGAIKYLENQCYDYVTNYFSFGASYHHYGEKSVDLLDRVYFPLSIDLGTGIIIKRTMIGFCFDFIKGEGTVNLGYSF